MKIPIGAKVKFKHTGKIGRIIDNNFLGIVCLIELEEDHKNNNEQTTQIVHMADPDDIEELQ